MIVGCSNCGKELERKPCFAKLKKNHFCNPACRSKWQTTAKKFNCRTCRRTVTRSPSELRKNKTGNVFCSRSCTATWNNQQEWRTRERHPNWLDGRGSYRALALKKYGCSCMNENCELSLAGIKVSKKMLDVDHIDEDRSNNRLDNLRVLCVWCHAKKTRRD